MNVESRSSVRVRTDIRVRTEDRTAPASYLHDMTARVAEWSQLSRRTLIGAGFTAITLPALLAACSGSNAKESDAAAPKTSVTGQLRSTPTTPFARSQHASALLPGGLILLIGGMSASGALASCQVYDPSDGSWFDAAPLGRARGLLSATPSADGRVLCLGGFDGANAFGVGSMFDPQADRWEPAKPLATPRYHHSALALGDGRVIVTGGFNMGPLSVPEIYEP